MPRKNILLYEVDNIVFTTIKVLVLLPLVAVIIEAHVHAIAVEVLENVEARPLSTAPLHRRYRLPSETPHVVLVIDNLGEMTRRRAEGAQRFGGNKDVDIEWCSFWQRLITVELLVAVCSVQREGMPMV